ncbi:MAG: alpha-L-fucosidase [Bacteroidales bacterium]|nr:alpha-L-fucosidase [Bacteroidales bacterium]
MKKTFLSLFIVLFGLMLTAQKPPKPYGPVPTPAQVEWQKMELNMFCHFGPNTFTGLEWGEGTEAEDIFNPTALDCNQWVTVAKNAGFRGIILTAKHHDGFCLWPNPESDHTVRESTWRNGKGDVLRELSEACRKGNVKFGIYISPWDRNAPTYGTPAYNKVFLRTLKHAHTNYGTIFEQWFDGANGEGPNGKRQVYDWKTFNAQTLKKQPRTVIFSDVGPGCRWVGNEEGKCGRTCWSRLDVEGREPGKNAPSQDTLNAGNYNGVCWIPAETDVSIRPGWFWRDSEHPKSVQELLTIYYNSVGRNSLLLLNVPPDNRGLIPAEDSLRLMEFRAALDSIFSNDLAKKAYLVNGSNMRTKTKDCIIRPTRFDPLWLIDDDYNTYWATDDSVRSAYVELKFNAPQTFNRVMVQEYIPLGQRVERFHIDVQNEDGSWHTIATETTIGYKRIVLTETVTTKRVRVYIDQSRACPVLNHIGLFMDRILGEQ